MRNFFKLAENTNVNPLLLAINQQPELWNQNELRTKHEGSAHAEADDIWLWFNKKDSKDVVNDIDVVPYPAWRKLPQARDIVFPLLGLVQGHRLGRVVITRLEPGKKITPHVDGGKPVEYYKRYQIALQSLPGAIFTIGDETVNFKKGDVWLINNKEEHSVQNNSEDDRIVMIVDIALG